MNATENGNRTTSMPPLAPSTGAYAVAEDAGHWLV